jgi:carboxymethylenebutenolidase
MRMHIGETDASIAMPDVDVIRAAQPKIESYVDPGTDHGFGCDDRGNSSKPDYDLPPLRTLGFVAKYLG